MQRMLRWLPAALLLTFLPGCPLLDWFKDMFGGKKPQTAQTQERNGASESQAEQGQQNSKAVIVSDGTTLVSKEEFKQNIDAMMQSQPELQQVLPMLDPQQQMQLYQQVAKQLQTQHAVMQYIKDQGLDETSEYRKQWKMLMQQVEQTLAMQTLQNELYQEVMRDVSEQEAKTYYNNYKEQLAASQPDTFIAKQGGVQASMVKADSKEQAESIKEAAQKNDFKQAAREYDKRVQDLGTVTQTDSQPNTAVVKKVTQWQSGQLPRIDVVSADDAYYVVKGTKRVEPEYAPFEKVKEQVKEAMLQSEFQEQYGKRVEELIKKYNVEIKDDVLNDFVMRGKDQQGEGSQEPEQPQEPASA